MSRHVATWSALAAALCLPVGVARAQCMGATAAGFDFAPAQHVLFETDFSDARGSAPPKGIRFVSGALAMADWEGRRAIQAASRATILIPTPPLGTDFSIELGLVHRNTRQIAGPSVSVYGGRAENFYPGSAALKFEYGTVYWQARGGGTSSTAQFSSEEADECVGAHTTFRLQGDGTDIKAYAGERLLTYLQDVKFNRAGGVLIEVGGGAEDNAVYITSIRIAGSAPASVASAVRPSGTSPGARPPAPTTSREDPVALPITVEPAPESQPAAVPITVKPATARELSGKQPSSVPQPATPPSDASAPPPASTANATTRARSTAAVSQATPPVSAEPAASPVPPTVVRARYIAEGQTMVSWSPVPGATGYHLVYRTPAGQMVGANELNVGNGGVADTLALTRQLDMGTYQIAVVSVFDGGAHSVPSGTVNAIVPRWYGRYEVSVNGFRAHSATFDDPLNYDGKGDEIVLAAVVQERGSPTASGPVKIATYVHGDQNHLAWRNNLSPEFRVAAGSAPGGVGGLLSGNHHPASPVKRIGGLGDRTFPLRLWQGELYEGMNSIEIAPELWETDDKPERPTPKGPSSYVTGILGVAGPIIRQLDSTITAGTMTAADSLYRRWYRNSVPFWWANADDLNAQGIRSAAYRKAAARRKSGGLLAANTALMTRLDGEADALAVAFAQRAKPAVTSALNAAGAGLQLLMNNKDRQIGLVERNGQPVYIPRWIVLDHEAAERIIAGDASLPMPQGFSLREPGIIEIRFTDAVAGANGDYSIYVEVRRVN